MGLSHRKQLLASSLAHLADELADVDIRHPDHTRRLNELASDVHDISGLITKLAEEAA